MANIVVVSNSNFVKVDFGDYGVPTRCFNKSNIEDIEMIDGVVKVITGGFRNSETFYVTYDMGVMPSNQNLLVKTMVVDSVNGSNPVDNNDLLDLIYNV